MPTLPTYTKCRELGCKNPRSKCNTFCIEHGGFDVYKAKESKKRAEFNSMYQTAYWKQTRVSQLSKQPLCQSCLSMGIIASARHVDHLFPWNSIGKDAFYHNIFQSLCHECHSHKTSLEQQGIYRFYDMNGYKDYAKHDYRFMVLQARNQAEK